MGRRYTKSDVQTHSDGYRPSNPAVNVKAYNFAHGGDVAEHFGCSDKVAERALEFAWNVASRSFWEDLQELADHCLGKGYNVYSEGRSSGWVVVHNMPDIENWDAVLLGKWRSFEKACKDAVAYLSSWDQVRDDIGANRWAEENAEEYNFFEEADGSSICFADVSRCAHCAT